MKDGDKVPVLIAWSPYGKTAGTAPRYIGLFNMLGMGNKWSSGLTKFEGPDPDYWCAQGYAVCNPDPRGIARSEGDITMIGSQEAYDAYDLIEWLATQEWCNGKTALTGTSYLTFPSGLSLQLSHHILPVSRLTKDCRMPIATSAMSVVFPIRTSLTVCRLIR